MNPGRWPGRAGSLKLWRVGEHGAGPWDNSRRQALSRGTAPLWPARALSHPEFASEAVGSRLD